MKITAVVFDMDGVLIDAREWHYEALNRALGHFGYTISRFDHLVTYDGLPTRHKLEMLSRERGFPDRCTTSSTPSSRTTRWRSSTPAASPPSSTSSP
jgi:beta-phosphoglucomutase-like phosphatase (HAD superfamily)